MTTGTRRLMRFKQSGINEFRHRLELSRTEGGVTFDDLVEDRLMVEPVGRAGAVPCVHLTTRRHAAETITEVLRAAEVPHSEAMHDVGLWTWMAAHWVDSLAPAAEDGVRRPGAPHRWIPSTTAWNTYHRHLLLGPYSIYHRYANDPDGAMCLLASAVGSPGELVEQIASNTQLVTNEKVVRLATRLYWDGTTEKFRPGAAGKNPGSVRRLVAVLNQFDRTWDFHSRDVDGILSMLPQEFAPFVVAGESSSAREN